MNLNTYRISICGSVDDGKSTLLGRLMYELGNYTEDKLEEVERISARNKMPQLDYSLFTDGLIAEREQGITIDVAHLYMTFGNKRIIWADAPGHEQYTRNMVTAASTSDAALLLNDVSRSITEQFKRHFQILQTLQTPKILIAINKMDTANHSEVVFLKRKTEIEELIGASYTGTIHFTPVSAIDGYNVVEKVPSTLYEYSVLSWIDTLQESFVDHPFNAQIQLAEHLGGDKRRYHLRIYDGVLKIGDVLKTVQNSKEFIVQRVLKFGKEIDEAYPSEAVSIEVDIPVDLSRGTELIHASENSRASQQLPAIVFNLDTDSELMPRKNYILQKGLLRTKARLSFQTSGEGSNSNEFSQTTLQTAVPIQAIEAGGTESKSFILIDESTNNTCALGILS